MAAAVAARPRFQSHGLGELLDRTIRLYRKHFFTFLGIMAIVHVPTFLIGVALGFALVAVGGTATANPFLRPNPSDVSPSDLGSLFLVYGLTFLTAIVSAVLVSGIGQAAFTRAVADSFFGERISIGGAYRRLGRSWLPLLGTLLLAMLAAFGLFIYWLVVPCLGWVTGLGAITVFTSTVVPLVTSVVVLERRSGFAALRRAWDLARTRFWWMLGLALILYLFGQLVISGPTLVLRTALNWLLPLVLDSVGLAGMIASITEGIVQATLSLIYTPLQLVAFTLVYFDLRARAEGLDLAAQTAPAETPLAEVVAQAPVTAGTGLVTAKELGYFAGLTVAFVVLQAVLFGALFAVMAAVFAATGGFPVQ
jgi:hypothetical protein